MNENSRGRRRHRRVAFVYPVEFKILTPECGTKSFSGLFATLSMSGASFQCTDAYGLLGADNIVNARIKLKVSVPKHEQLILFARIRWMSKEDSAQKLSIMIGVEFEKPEESQLDVLESMITLRNKEHKMMWSLWDDLSAEVVSLR